MSSQGNAFTAVCGIGAPYQLPAGYKKEQFRYPESMPWPSQPKDGNACKIAPEVLKVGPNAIDGKEWEKWNDSVGVNLLATATSNFSSAYTYARTILGLPEPGIFATAAFGFTAEEWSRKGEHPSGWGAGDKGPYPSLDDARFTDMMAHGLLSKLLSRLDTADIGNFAQFMHDQTREFWKTDLTHMRVVRETLDGEYVAPTVVLWSRPHPGAPGQTGESYDFKVHAIVLYAQSKPGGPYDDMRLFKPGNAKAWQQAKYFALQGALVRINLIDHTMVHFPNDAINAISKSLLPISNPIFQLLEPHFLLSLPVDNSVLEGDFSLLNRTWNYPYSPYPAKGPEIRKTFAFYWQGWKASDDPAEAWARNRDHGFPEYRFSVTPREIPSRYGTFLNAYYPPILAFTTAVALMCNDKDWEEISRWAQAVSSWIPGFPDGKQISKNKDLLARTCAAIIWNVAIVHSADHWMMHDMFEQKLPTPYILRDQPPEAVASLPGVPGGPPGASDYRPEVFADWDAFPARMCDVLFFQPHNTQLMIETTYAFSHLMINAQVPVFHGTLTAVDNLMHSRFPEFGIRMGSANDPEKETQCFASSVQF